MIAYHSKKQHRQDIINEYKEKFPDEYSKFILLSISQQKEKISSWKTVTNDELEKWKTEGFPKLYSIIKKKRDFRIKFKNKQQIPKLSGRRSSRDGIRRTGFIIRNGIDFHF